MRSAFCVHLKFTKLFSSPSENTKDLTFTLRCGRLPPKCCIIITKKNHFYIIYISQCTILPSIFLPPTPEAYVMLSELWGQGVVCKVVALEHRVLSRGPVGKHCFLFMYSCVKSNSCAQSVQYSASWTSGDCILYQHICVTLQSASDDTRTNIVSFWKCLRVPEACLCRGMQEEGIMVSCDVML